jgi:hypothetical protein
MTGVPARRWMALAVLAAAAPLGSGCAVMAVADAVSIVKALPSDTPRWVETNRLEFGYPVGAVYEQLLQGVEHGGRKLVGQDASTHTLQVSYSLTPFRWGGSLRITCVATTFGTLVTIEGDGRDPVASVRKIGDEVLDDLGGALRRLPRTL